MALYYSIKKEIFSSLPSFPRWVWRVADRKGLTTEAQIYLYKCFLGQNHFSMFTI